MPDKIHGPNYRWRRGLIDSVYAAAYPSRGGGSAPEPLLTAASVTVINETSANAAVSANQNNGVLYWVASTSAAQPTATQIKAGQTNAGSAAPASGSQAISESGVQTVFGGVIGLTQGTTYWIHFYFETDALEPSNILTSASFVPADVTAPVLSSAEGTQTGATTANLTVNTDTASGTLFWVATTSATTPSAAQIIAGQDHTGAAAVGASRAVSASGPQAFGITGLAGSTTYWAHFVHRDTALNVSVPITVSASFTTASITYYFEAYNNGTVPGVHADTNSVRTTNFEDPDGGSNAVLWAGDGLGAATAETVRFGPSILTFADGVTRIRCRFRTVARANAKMTLRIRAENVTSSDIVHIDITNDSTPDASRVQAVPSMLNASCVAIGGDWLQFQADYDATGDADRAGGLYFYMSPTLGSAAIVNNVAGANQIAVHNLTFEQI
jgi:hypothetical protein